MPLKSFNALFAIRKILVSSQTLFDSLDFQIFHFLPVCARSSLISSNLTTFVPFEKMFLYHLNSAAKKASSSLDNVFGKGLSAKIKASRGATRFRKKPFDARCPPPLDKFRFP